MDTVVRGSDQAISIYTTGLRNQHAVEKQAIELLNRQIERLENYPELEARMRTHVEESRNQAQRLEQILSSLDSSHSSIKDAALGFMGNMAAIMHTVAADEVIKNSLANYAFEHFEIASYKSLITIAETLSHSDAQRLLGQSLNEEQAMAQWIDDHLRETTLTYMRRAESGQKAGV